jgi:hypothetical protein
MRERVPVSILKRKREKKEGKGERKETVPGKKGRVLGEGGGLCPR